MAPEESSARAAMLAEFLASPPPRVLLLELW